jgi:hypothetical protein
MVKLKNLNSKNIFLFVLFLTTFYSLGQKKKCKDLGNGTYVYNDPAYSDWVVYRKDSIQIESNTRTGIELHMIIKWVSNCNYTLTYTKTLNNHKENLFIGKTMDVEILSTDNNVINYRCNLEGIVLDGGMIQISDKINRIHTRGIRKKRLK